MQEIPQTQSLAVQDQPPLFDYFSLPTEKRTTILQAAADIKARVKRTQEDVLAIGEKLVEVRMSLEHGEWEAWLRTEFDWSEQTARRFIQVHEAFKDQKQQIVGFDLSALYQLAAPSAPEAAKAEAIERAASGEPITGTAAKEMVERHKEHEAAVAGVQQELEPEGAGTCRVCGCTETEACVDEDTETGTCAWVEGEGRTLCTVCPKLMAQLNLDEPGLKARLDAEAAESQSPATGETDADEPEDEQEHEAQTAQVDDEREEAPEASRAGAEAAYQKRKRTMKKEPAKPLRQSASKPKAASAKQAKEAKPQSADEMWDKSLITITIQLHPVDKHADGRRVNLGVRVGEFMPNIAVVREADLGSIAALPPPLFDLISRVKDKLPEVAAAAKAQKTEAAKPAPKSPVKPAKATKATKKSRPPARNTKPAKSSPVKKSKKGRK